MNDRVNFIKDLAVGYINAYYLENLIQIPYSSVFKEYIKNPTVHSKDGYLLIDADADLDSISVPKFLN